MDFNIFDKKRKFDNNEIKVTELSEQELTAINEIYNKEIEELQSRIKRKMIELSKK
ncbi:MAG: hypothetical protein IJE68_03475 [Clostridia bacterium]|nr:hypothetical protein [Clostridia bacterium]